MAQDIFLRLIELGPTEQDTTRRRAARAEFERADSPEQAQQMRETLEVFIRARLLTTNQITGTGKTTVEVSHEALFRKWDRLAGWLTKWLSDKRKDILLQQSLSKDAEEGKQQNRPRDRLYRGAQLKEAQEWARRDSSSKEEVAFLKASAIQRTLSLVSLVILVLLLISSAGVAGWFDLTRPPDPTRVTTLQDNVSGSLRYCINNAPSGSTITFTQGLSGTIKLIGSLALVSGKQLTILGSGADHIIISSGSTDSNIHISKGAKLDISGLSFNNSETVLSAFLFNEGTLTLTNSIISDNKASGKQDSQGGGILSTGPTGFSAIIRFCTIYGNISSAGGGIWVDPTGSSHMTISSSIIAANRASDGPDISGALISDGYNRIENVAGSKVRYATTDKQVTLADLKLDPTLRNNGGSTQTLALLPDSPAIDAVPRQACSITLKDPFGLMMTITTDQRGNPRLDGSENTCDIGAYESAYEG
jgi:hypothetical protein